MSHVADHLVPGVDTPTRSGHHVERTPGPWGGAPEGGEIVAAPVEAVHPWRSDAACAGMRADLFFPGRGESPAEAKAVCRGCPVRDACLADALEGGERFGVWGGLSERERRRRLRRRARSTT